MSATNTPQPAGGSQPAPSPCETCGRGVGPAEAQVSRRALGAVRCWRCRRPDGPDPDDGREEVILTRAWGLWEASLSLAGRRFTGHGLTAEVAGYRARLKAQAAG